MADLINPDRLPELAGRDSNPLIVVSGTVSPKDYMTVQMPPVRFAADTARDAGMIRQMTSSGWQFMAEVDRVAYFSRDHKFSKVAS